jgi:hypothetical protein
MSRNATHFNSFTTPRDHTWPYPTLLGERITFNRPPRRRLHQECRSLPHLLYSWFMNQSYRSNELSKRKMCIQIRRGENIPYGLEIRRKDTIIFSKLKGRILKRRRWQKIWWRVNRDTGGLLLLSLGIHRRCPRRFGPKKSCDNCPGSSQEGVFGHLPAWTVQRFKTLTDQGIITTGLLTFFILPIKRTSGSIPFLDSS